MNWRILSIGFTFVLTLTTSPMLLADGEETGIAHRVAALEQQMTALMADQERVSPDPDLTGKTYCVISLGIGLQAEAGVSARVHVNPIQTMADFTSPTQLTVTEISNTYTWVNFPSYTMNEEDDSKLTEGTYTIVGSQLAVTLDDDEGSYTYYVTLTPDGQVFIGSLVGREVDEGVDKFAIYLQMGVQADSCDF